MDDKQIVALYFDRNEQAIAETEIKYGKYCYAIAIGVLSMHEDAEESESDTYMQTCDTIPPQHPRYFFAYLAKICRNAALGMVEWKSAAKRTAEIVTLTREMEECIPDRAYERKLEGEQIGETLNRFLDSISQESRLIFLRRYWYADSIQEIADRYRISQSKVKTQLHRTRNRLKLFLEKEGIFV